MEEFSSSSGRLFGALGPAPKGNRLPAPVGPPAANPPWASPFPLSSWQPTSGTHGGGMSPHSS